jgi:hypothetical protein
MIIILSIYFWIGLMLYIVWLCKQAKEDGSFLAIYFVFFFWVFHIPFYVLLWPIYVVENLYHKTKQN